VDLSFYYRRVALIRGPGPDLQEQRAVMDEFANTSTDAAGFSEIKTSIEEMHHASLCRQSFSRGCFYGVGWNGHRTR